jgi:hypothetical protein
MNGSSHEFFGDQAYEQSRQATPLSSYFDSKLPQDNEAFRDPQVPDRFQIPDQYLENSSDAAEVIDIVGNTRLRPPGSETITYRPFQVRVLNVIFAADRPVTDREILGQTLTPTSSEYRQLKAIHELFEKSKVVARFLVHHQLDDEAIAVGIDPSVRFKDRRSESQLGSEQYERKQILSSLCNKFNDHPDVLRELPTYAARPLPASIPEDWSARKLMQYQMSEFEVLSRDESGDMFDELDCLIEAYKQGSMSEDDQKQAVVLYNKLVCSFLGLGHAVAYSTLSRGSKGIRSPVSGLLSDHPNNSLDKPTDDLYALASLGVAHAIQTFSKAKGDPVNHIITLVGYTIRDGIDDDRRHMYGNTHHEMGQRTRGSRRRIVIRGRDEADNPYSLPEPRTPAFDFQYEALLRTLNTTPFVHAIFQHPDLRPAEKLILSLTQGIYNEEFEGKVLTGANGETFVYDASFASNPLFREGMQDLELSKMFSVDLNRIARLRQSAMKKVEDLAKRNLLLTHSKSTWEDWFW